MPLFFCILWKTLISRMWRFSTCRYTPHKNIERDRHTEIIGEIGADNSPSKHGLLVQSYSVPVSAKLWMSDLYLSAQSVSFDAVPGVYYPKNWLIKSSPFFWFLVLYFTFQVMIKCAKNLHNIKRTHWNNSIILGTVHWSCVWQCMVSRRWQWTVKYTNRHHWAGCACSSWWHCNGGCSNYITARSWANCVSSNNASQGKDLYVVCSILLWLLWLVLLQAPAAFGLASFLLHEVTDI